MTMKERIQDLLRRANNTVCDIDFNDNAAVIDRLEWALDNTIEQLEMYKMEYGEFIFEDE